MQVYGFTDTITSHIVDDMNSESSYIPGMCNINAAEIAYRRKAMWFGIIASVAAMAVLIVVNASWWLGAIMLFVPVYIAAIGYLQVKNKFCVSYGASGRQNADDESETAITISDADALKADRRKTRRMNLQALGMMTATLAIACAVLYVV